MKNLIVLVIFVVFTSFTLICTAMGYDFTTPVFWLVMIALFLGFVLGVVGSNVS